MTTIACDGKTLATDCALEYQGKIIQPVRKIFKVHKNSVNQKYLPKCDKFVYVTASGNYDTILNYIAFLNGHDDIEIPQCEFNFIIATDLGETFNMLGKYSYYLFSPPFAEGSGWQLALGAMRFGATAEQAVEFASLIDTGTKQPITVISLNR